MSWSRLAKDSWSAVSGVICMNVLQCHMRSPLYWQLTHNNSWVDLIWPRIRNLLSAVWYACMSCNTTWCHPSIDNWHITIHELISSGQDLQSAVTSHWFHETLQVQTVSLISHCTHDLIYPTDCSIILFLNWNTHIYSQRYHRSRKKHRNCNFRTVSLGLHASKPLTSIPEPLHRQVHCTTPTTFTMSGRHIGEYFAITRQSLGRLSLYRSNNIPIPPIKKLISILLSCIILDILKKVNNEVVKYWIVKDIVFVLPFLGHAEWKDELGEWEKSHEERSKNHKK